MQRKQYSIDYMKRLYRGEYQIIISQDGTKTCVIEPELKELDSKLFKVNYIDNVNMDYGIDKRAYYIKKFLSELLREISTEKIKIDDKNKTIIKYWTKYVEDLQTDEIYERVIVEDAIYSKLLNKQDLFIDIIENNCKKKLLLMDKEISPKVLGVRSEFTKLLLKKLVENINNNNKHNDTLTIAIVNDSENFIKDNLFHGLKGSYKIISLDNYYEEKVLKKQLLGKFDHIISVNSLHLIEDVEDFFKASKLMLKENGQLHVIDFGKMDPVSILTAIFFQEKYLDIETEKRTQFFYRIDYIKKLAEKYYIKNSLLSIKNNIAYYFKLESYTNYLGLIKNLENNIGNYFDESIVLFSSKSLDSYNSRNGITKGHVDNYNEDVEDILKTIWIQNLEIDDVNKNSNYFKLGGNSLSATKLLVEIERKLKCKLTLNEVFSNPEFEDLLKLIDLKQLNTEIIEGEI
ncbi:TPA: acyl carrier protein [Streptococcus agalactiae]|nr:acyl carrier protein [Streptococcus agalactiae]HEO1202237.1 acyl carrier protein [Streptococcus agalactiae]